MNPIAYIALSCWAWGTNGDDEPNLPFYAPVKLWWVYADGRMEYYGIGSFLAGYLNNLTPETDGLTYGYDGSIALHSGPDNIGPFEGPPACYVAEEWDPTGEFDQWGGAETVQVIRLYPSESDMYAKTNALCELFDLPGYSEITCAGGIWSSQRLCIALPANAGPSEFWTDFVGSQEVAR